MSGVFFYSVGKPLLGFPTERLRPLHALAALAHSAGREEFFAQQSRTKNGLDLFCAIRRKFCEAVPLFLWNPPFGLSHRVFAAVDRMVSCLV